MRVSNNHHQWLSIYNNIFFKEFFSLSSLIYFYVLTSLKFKAIYCAKMLSKCHKALRRDFFTHEENLFCSHLISHESLFLSLSQHFYCLAFFFSFWCSSSWKSWLLDNFPYCCFFFGISQFLYYWIMRLFLPQLLNTHLDLSDKSADIRRTKIWSIRDGHMPWIIITILLPDHMLGKILIFFCVSSQY